MNSLVQQIQKLSASFMSLTILITFSLIAPVTLQAKTAEQEKTPASLPGMLPAFISAGNVDPNGKVPTVNGVPGSGTENLDIAFPVQMLTHGTRYVYSVVVQDYNYTGNCKVSFKLTQIQNGKKVTLDSGTITTFKTAPGNVWLWVILGNAIPDSPGAATLTGILNYGSHQTVTNTAVVLQ